MLGAAESLENLSHIALTYNYSAIISNTEIT